MPLKCRCVCGCKLMVSLGSVGKSIKCPQCDRRLRVPKDAIARRRKQLAKKEAKASPKPPTESEERAGTDPHSPKLKTRLSSLVDIPEPEAPPVHELDSGNATSPIAEPAAKAAESEQRPQPDKKKRKKKSKKQKAQRKENRKKKRDDSARPKSEPTIAAADEAPSLAEESSSQQDAAAKPEKDREQPAATKTPPEMPTRTHKSEEGAPKQPPQPESVAAFSEPQGVESDPPSLESFSEEDDLPVHGYQADRDKLVTVRWLAAALLAVAMFGLVPAIREITVHLQLQDGTPLSRWVYAAFLVGGLQLAYAGYLIQLPDWSSVWVVTVFSLLVAGLYAAMFCLTLLAGNENQVVRALDLAELLRGGKVTGWCLVMLCITGLLAYSGGRVGSRWRQAFAM